MKHEKIDPEDFAKFLEENQPRHWKQDLRWQSIRDLAMTILIIGLGAFLINLVEVITA